MMMMLVEIMIKMIMNYDDDVDDKKSVKDGYGDYNDSE